MKKRFFLLGFIFAFPFAAISSTPLDQYKQMGGISGIAETCLGETELGYALTESLIIYLINTPSSTKAVANLYDTYVNSYNKATSDFKIWIGSKQMYSEKGYYCNNQEDMNFIKQSSDSITRNLKNGFTVSD